MIEGLWFLDFLNETVWFWISVHRAKLILYSAYEINVTTYMIGSVVPLKNTGLNPVLYCIASNAVKVDHWFWGVVYYWSVTEKQQSNQLTGRLTMLWRKKGHFSWEKNENPIYFYVTNRVGKLVYVTGKLAWKYDLVKSSVKKFLYETQNASVLLKRNKLWP